MTAISDKKMALVTGGTRGIGRAISVTLAAAGYHVVATYHSNTASAEATVSEITSTGGTVETVAFDVADPEQAGAAMEDILSRFDAIDVLVNNAGIGTAVPALKETPEQFRSVVDVNLNGAFWAAKECAAVMGPGSSIVNVASVLGLTAGFAPQAAYSATKAAVMGLTRDLASQWGGRRGIRVNSLAPGYFASEMTDEIPEAMLADITGRTIFGRLGLQPELDAALLFLASDASSFITGTTLVVDGGMTLH